MPGQSLEERQAELWKVCVLPRTDTALFEARQEKYFFWISKEFGPTSQHSTTIELENEQELSHMLEGEIAWLSPRNDTTIPLWGKKEDS